MVSDCEKSRNRKVRCQEGQGRGPSTAISRPSLRMRRRWAHMEKDETEEAEAREDENARRGD